MLCNYKHDYKLIKKYEKACSEVFLKISKLNRLNKIRENLRGPVKLMGFKD